MVAEKSEKNDTKMRGGGVFNKLRGSGIYKINDLFKKDVLKGFTDYKKIVSEYGKDVAIFSTAWRGTGDYFICGLYLHEYLQVNRIENYVFLVPPNGGERKVMDLFEVYNLHFLEMDNIVPIRIFNSFLAKQTGLLHHFHHGSPNPRNSEISVSSSVHTGFEFTGYNGLNMVDFYLYCGFRLHRNANKSLPNFVRDVHRINEWFKKNNLVKQKTVILSPYSTGLKQYEIPLEFWNSLAVVLKNKGYSLVTNCAGMEKSILGTIALNIPYSEIVPFLEEAGCFIGIRSGLCDIIAGARCKKLIIHTYKAKWWRDGKSITYTGLNNMGLCNDAIEYEYKNDGRIAELLNHTLKYIK